MRTRLLGRLVDDHDALVGSFVPNPLHDRPDDRQTHWHRRNCRHSDGRGRDRSAAHGGRGDAANHRRAQILPQQGLLRVSRRLLASIFFHLSATVKASNV